LGPGWWDETTLVFLLHAWGGGVKPSCLSRKIAQESRNLSRLAEMTKREMLFVALAALVTFSSSAFAFRGEVAGEQPFWLALLVPSLLLGLLALGFAYREQLLEDWLRPRGGDMFVGLVGALLMFAAAWAFAHYVTPVGTPRERWLARLYLQFGSPAALRAHLGLTLIGVLVIAAAEELVWRGAVTYFLEAKFGSRRAWMVSAAICAVAHLPTAFAMRDPSLGWNPVLVLAALGGGIVWGIVARMFGRLTPTIFAHALFNWLVLVQFRLWGPSA
jgi:uncharacterized protein